MRERVLVVRGAQLAETVFVAEIFEVFVVGRHSARVEELYDA